MFSRLLAKEPLSRDKEISPDKRGEAVTKFNQMTFLPGSPPPPAGHVGGEEAVWLAGPAPVNELKRLELFGGWLGLNSRAGERIVTN